jgi:hypothetical protein
MWKSNYGTIFAIMVLFGFLAIPVKNASGGGLNKVN